MTYQLYYFMTIRIVKTLKYFVWNVVLNSRKLGQTGTIKYIQIISLIVVLGNVPE